MGKQVSLKDVVTTTEDERFVRFKNPDWREGVYRGELYEQAYHWTGTWYTPCSGTPDCQLCKTGRLQVRYAFNFVVMEQGKVELRIIELPFRATALLRDVINEYGPNSLIRITRSGQASETRYEVKFKRKLTREEVEVLDKISPFDLEEIFKEKLSKASTPEVA